MCWIFIKLIQLQYFYQLDMCWIFITVDTTPNSINLICVGYLSTVIELQILSTWYMFDIYQLDMSWYLSTLICFQFLSTWYVLVFINIDMLPISINLICLGYLSSWYNSNISINLICVGYLSTWYNSNISIDLICVGYLSLLIRLQILSTWYVLDIHQHWQNSKFYQLDMSWIFINIDRTPNSINLICLGYLSTPICLSFLSTWYVLDIYQHGYVSKIYQLYMSWIFINTNMFPILFMWYILDISTLIGWIFINSDMAPRFINLICLGYYFHEYDSKIYQLDMSWIFIDTDIVRMSIIVDRIPLYQLGRSDIYLCWYDSHFYQCWYVLDIYRHE
jgi:hypothetical protein